MLTLSAVLMAWVAALAGTIAVERLILPHGSPAPLLGHRRDRAIRVLALSMLFGFWLALSARPGFAAIAAIVTVAVLAGVSREKYRHLREPLVFSDVVLLAELVRHPSLFYLTRRDGLVVAAGIAALGAIIAGWTALEPRGLGAAAQAGCGLALIGLVVLWARAGARSAPVRYVRAQDAVMVVGRYGQFAALLLSVLGWASEPDAADLPSNAPFACAEAFAHVVIVQSESFTDLRRHGLDLTLPAFDRLSARALARGRLMVPCYGAYTNRPEFGLITGIPFESQGLDRYHPYLRPHRFAAHSLARRLKGLGWDSVFVHPHDARFFRRDRAIPALGFGRFLDEAAFTGAERCGPYISDAAVGDLLCAEIASASGRPLLLMCVTMEAHDPYGPGRIPETGDPVAQYAHHVAHADALLGRLAATLDSLPGRSLLVFYGDHAPLLPGYEALADDTATDYLVVECGPAAATTVPVLSAPLTPSGLNALLRARLGLGS